MTSTYQLELTLPGAEPRGQLDIFTVLPAYVNGEPARWSNPPRDITTWQGMAEELAERLLDFEALTLPAQGLVIGAALAHTYDNGQTLGEYLEGMHKVGTEQRTADGLAKFIAKDALAMSNAWGVEQ